MAEKKEKRYVSDNAQLMAEWDWEKNNEINIYPKATTCGSHRVAFWKCMNGHSWSDKIETRSRGYKCPYCTGKRPIIGENDFATVHPELLSEWNYDKNTFAPHELLPSSGKKVWWKCEKGHEWEASIYSRVAGNGCPYCANKKLLKGYNDLRTVAPNITKEWNYEKNGDLSPEDVIAKTDRTVWWRCDKGHEWQARISNRMNGNNCPYCANKKVLYGYNDLRTWCIVNGKLYLIDEFDTVKNGFNMFEISPGSSKKIWWICSNNHSYCTSLSHRINMNTGCPYCSNKKLLPGYNDLATTHPQIAKEWDYDKNGNVTPFDVMAGSNNKKYWFLCENGHSYASNLLNRKKGHGCPICAREKRKKSQ